MARGTHANATWHAAPRGPTHGGGADMWQGHTSPRGRPGGATWRCERLASDGPTG